MSKDKRSFFERLTGSYNVDESDQIIPTSAQNKKDGMEEMEQEEAEEGQLTIDVYQTPTDVIVQAFVAGLKPEDLDISIAQDMITLQGKREDSRRIEKDNFFYQELYWGSFSRSFLLPQEVDADEAEASMKGGILTIKLPKIDKGRIQKLKIRGE